MSLFLFDLTPLWRQQCIRQDCSIKRHSWIFRERFTAKQKNPRILLNPGIDLSTTLRLGQVVAERGPYHVVNGFGCEAEDRFVVIP